MGCLVSTPAAHEPPSGAANETEKNSAGAKNAKKSEASSVGSETIPAHGEKHAAAATVVETSVDAATVVETSVASDSLDIPERQGSVQDDLYILRKTDDVNKHYTILEELGHGQFGTVYVAQDKRTLKRVAIKSMSKRKADLDPNFSKDVRTEIEIMYLLGGHKNIVQLYAVYEDEHTVYLVMELCEGGDWFERLLEKGTYSERQAAATVRSVLEALQYCHSMGVVHRDLKPENLLLTDRSDTASVKLADFGLSALVPGTALQDPGSRTSDSMGLLHDSVGSPYYVAPEVLMAKTYGKEVDVWSLGAVLFIALGGYPPFDGPNEQAILKAVVYNPLTFDDPTWDRISKGAKDILTKMLTKDPRRRATIPELLSHPWLSVTRLAEPTAGMENRVPDTVVTRLQQFARLTRFKKQARKVLARFLPEEEVIGLLRLFKEMDTDGDGVLSVAELRQALALKGFPIPQDQARALLASIDIDCDGVIDYEEFLAATVHQQRLNNDECMLKAFQHFDRDGSGFITQEELKEAMAEVARRHSSVGGGVSDENSAALLRDIDADADGRINYEEFCAYMRVRDAGGSSAALLQQLSRTASRNNAASGPAWRLLNSLSNSGYADVAATRAAVEVDRDRKDSGPGTKRAAARPATAGASRSRSILKHAAPGARSVRFRARSSGPSSGGSGSSGDGGGAGGGAGAVHPEDPLAMQPSPPHSGGGGGGGGDRTVAVAAVSDGPRGGGDGRTASRGGSRVYLASVGSRKAAAAAATDADATGGSKSGHRGLVRDAPSIGRRGGASTADVRALVRDASDRGRGRDGPTTCPTAGTAAAGGAAGGAARMLGRPDSCKGASASGNDVLPAGVPNSPRPSSRSTSRVAVTISRQASVSSTGSEDADNRSRTVSCVGSAARSRQVSRQASRRSSAKGGHGDADGGSSCKQSTDRTQLTAVTPAAAAAAAAAGSASRELSDQGSSLVSASSAAASGGDGNGGQRSTAAAAQRRADPTVPSAASAAAAAAVAAAAASAAAATARHAAAAAVAGKRASAYDVCACAPGGSSLAPLAPRSPSAAATGRSSGGAITGVVVLGGGQGAPPPARAGRAW
ncbi:hypothetical protein FOA52_003798 [Chlamydomonas sp. UWO 241]|nr:hypothetical protein FOA52_003798 [Chlamydomonas sp. UWO 241]